MPPVSRHTPRRGPPRFKQHPSPSSRPEPHQIHPQMERRPHFGTWQPQHPVNTGHFGPEAPVHAYQLSNSGASAPAESALAGALVPTWNSCAYGIVHMAAQLPDGDRPVIAV